MTDYKIENGEEYYKDLQRSLSSDWIGWQIIDFYKKRNGFFQDCHDKCSDLPNLYKHYKNLRVYSSCKTQ